MAVAAVHGVVHSSHPLTPRSMSRLQLHAPFASLRLVCFVIFVRSPGHRFCVCDMACLHPSRWYVKDTLEVKILGNWVDIMFSPRRPQQAVLQSQQLKEPLALWREAGRLASGWAGRLASGWAGWQAGGQAGRQAGWQAGGLASGWAGRQEGHEGRLASGWAGWQAGGHATERSLRTSSTR